MVSVTMLSSRLAVITRVCAAITVALLAPPALTAQSSTVWSQHLPSAIKDGAVLANGFVGVVTDSGLSVLAPADGHELWQKRGVCCFWSAGLASMVVQQSQSGAVLELDRGTEQWLLGALPIDAVLGFRAIPQRNLLLVYGIAGRVLRLVAASLDSGVVRWQQDTLFQGVADLLEKGKEIRLSDAQPVLLDTDSTLVIFPTKGGVMRLDGRTGALLWRVDSLTRTAPPVVDLGYSRLVADSSVILVPFERRLMAVRTTDGKVLWEHSENFPSRLAQIEVTPHGYLVRGYFKGDKPSPAISPFVDLLDPVTGLSRWPKPIRDLDNASAMLLRGDTVWLASRRQLFAVALPAGQISQRATFEFKGDELPAAMEELDGMFVLLASHNLVGVTPSGKVRYQLYYPRPGSSLLSKMLSTALVLGVATAGYATGYQPIYLPGPNPVADPSYARVLLAQRYVHMLTGAKDSAGTKGFSVVRIEKSTGEEVGRVWVDDRSPDYLIDSAGGLLYLIRDKTTLEAFRF